MGGGQFLATGPLALPGRLLGAAVAAGLVLAGVRAARAASTPPTPRPVGPRTGRVANGGARGSRLSTAPAGATGRLVAWSLTLAMVPLTMLAMAGYVAEGGGTHARYL
jgi:hypothetical protein